MKLPPWALTRAVIVDNESKFCKEVWLPTDRTCREYHKAGELDYRANEAEARAFWDKLIHQFGDSYSDSNNQ